ncbi:hypothetical protein bcgnr5378_62230 [Bacillus cereus]|uniref:hypothetical protein n=1 Tax=Bacillus cereus group TaxID=86661 RepID=UPI001015B01F|nr:MULTISPECIES: hypothetical protein [Bacillus cereus group]MDA1532009.1 hypothetical protein [Bacillus cereus group sp. TH260-2LC]MDX5906286.1 hypothetical protein [Bacillus cereus group sp. BfR-BA-01048]MDZ4627223.1 hypothetical protein [Bacillus cereus]BCC62437.1 hypothetical protein BCJMU10_p304 [Bacillus cereus]BCD32941.1 hypothetical protein BC30102_p433 [Bacillus cereus]
MVGKVNFLSAIPRTNDDSISIETSVIETDISEKLTKRKHYYEGEILCIRDSLRNTAISVLSVIPAIGVPPIQKN